jgi:hypothetical protein
MTAPRRRYPKVKGGGQVPFTPENPPPITDETLQHIIVGAPITRGRSWSGGHGPRLKVPVYPLSSWQKSSRWCLTEISMRSTHAASPKISQRCVVAR